MGTKTFRIKSEEVEHNWYIIDANNRVLGRLATKIATVLMGKHKPYFSHDTDCGDFVIVTNASKIKITGKKLDTKFEYRHSGYPGGDKYIPYKKLIKTNPSKIIYLAVKNMLPKNKLRAKFLKRLKIYPDNTHPHIAQNPITLS
jgi:large subunit ribosomal protein L13